MLRALKTLIAAVPMTATALSFTPLPDLGAGGLARDVNDSGLVTGWVIDPETYATLPALWRDGILEPLDSEPFSNAIAEDLNNAGQIVGRAMGEVEDGFRVFPVIWQDGKIAELPSLGLGGAAQAINEDGTVAGFVYGPVGILPATWRDGVLELLPIPDVVSPFFSVARTPRAIRGNRIVGTVGDLDNRDIATSWVDGILEPLPVGDLRLSYGVAPAPDGTLIAGLLTPEAGRPMFGVLKGDGKFTFYQEVEGTDHVIAYGITGSGVGFGSVVTVDPETYEFRSKPALWDQEGSVGLLPLPDEAVWGAVYGANDTGTAAGQVMDAQNRYTPGIWSLIGNRPPVGASIPPAMPGEATELTGWVTHGGRPVVGRDVSFLLDGKTIAKGRTDIKGKVRIRYRMPETIKAGLHPVMFSLGGSRYLRTMMQAEWIPTRLAARTRPSILPGQTAVIAGNLNRGRGDSRPIANVPVVLQVDGQTMTTRTDAMGRYGMTYRVPINARRGTNISFDVRFPGNDNHRASWTQTTTRVR